jgi:Protein of unknown function (DUF3037)
VKDLTTQPRPFSYSILKAVPDPKRGESINLGVIVIDSKGDFADVRYGSIARIRKIDSNADLDSIRSFLFGITANLSLHGQQTRLDRPEASIDVATLAMWSREFGGSVQVTEPRSVLATDPARLLDQLFEDYVATPKSGPAQTGISSRQRRSQVLSLFDRSVERWGIVHLQSFAGATIRGRWAHHKVDRLLAVNSSQRTAIIEVINFASRDLTETFGRRAAICLAAEDLRDESSTRRVSAFALHGPAPYDRVDELEESAALFNAKGVTPVMINDVDPIRQSVAADFT